MAFFHFLFRIQCIMLFQNRISKNWSHAIIIFCNVNVTEAEKCYRISTRIWSRALRRQLESITDSSSEMCCTTKVVQAQIEANPAASVSNSQEASETFESKPSSCNCGNSPRLVLDQRHLNVEKGKKISSVVANKLKSLKKTLICSRFVDIPLAIVI